MSLRIHNTLTRRKEPFEPLHPPRVSLFVCGITPHDATHMGHAKTYVAFDVVARWLRHRGYALFYVQNVTDIEDRVIEKVHAWKRDWQDIVAEYWADYRAAMDALNCTSVNLYAWATHYLPEIHAQIQALIDSDHAYVSDGDVYFDTTTYGKWGELSGQKVEEHRPGARVAIDERKRHPSDFALWKAQKPGEPAWDSPWGKGRPGWHIEDTAITVTLFGPQYDIHGGARELAFPHHEAEIAQAESVTGKAPFVRTWMHGGMLMIAGEEMHKSLGNFWSVSDALKRYDGEVLRFYLLHAHYRSPIDFSLEGLDEAEAAYGRLRDAIGNLRSALRKAPETGPADADLDKAREASEKRFEESMDDDFNTREAIAATFDFVAAANLAMEAGLGKAAIERALATFRTWGDVLGLFQREAGKAKVLERLLDFIVQLREDARSRKDFKVSDEIRAKLAELGVALEDTKDGVRWKLR